MIDACGADHCVTCSDEGVAMRVVRLVESGLARCVDGEGNEQEVMTDLVASVAPDDRLLVHAGVALTKVAENAERFRR